MTTIIQKMWRDGVPGPDGGLVRIAERERPKEFPTYKCEGCDGITISTSTFPDCSNCGLPLEEYERL
jgi:hypothetical protein